MKKEVINETPSRILKIGTCSTLSGRSELSFHLGCTADGEIQFRIVSNSGNGQFNSDWVALTIIEKLLTQHPAEKLMTSKTMQPVFRGKSSNSPAFLFAVLKAEGLVTAGTEKDSGHLLGDIDAFKKNASALITSGTDLAVATEAPPVPLKKKRPAKESV
ncbi:hypothetical protein [Dechloromonas denitrificans]|uniref:hypothetical protein n=1 Tax=Dechloromonas denitrificans TaxID=281362 RepID=UPI001CFA558B|nr:hypothetical protein [Dechloromonas denitrificans]UCV07206.1 hypothetical protein KI615_17645 [Dechloromonas denitrificans]